MKKKYFIFLFSCSGNEAKRGIEIHRSTHNVSRIWRTVGNRSDLMRTECLSTKLPDSHSFLLCPGYRVKLNKFKHLFSFKILVKISVIYYIYLLKKPLCTMHFLSRHLSLQHNHTLKQSKCRKKHHPSIQNSI